MQPGLSNEAMQWPSSSGPMLEKLVYALVPLHLPGLQLLRVFLSLLRRCNHRCNAVAMSCSLTRWLA